MSAPEKCPKCGAELLSRSFGELTFYCGSRNSHPSQDSVWLQESAVCIRNQRDQLAERVKRLESSADTLIDAIESVQCWNDTHVGDCIDQLKAAKGQP